MYKNNETQLELRPYQKEAIKVILGPGRKVLDITCGLGKTLIAGHILKESNYEKIICIAPLRISIEQLMERITPFLPKYKHILVDSEGTTDENIIKKFIIENKNFVIYSTYKSFINILNNILIGNEYLIVDEVHNALNMIEIFNKYFNILFMSATIPEEFYESMKEIKTIYKYNMMDGIKNGYICEYEIYLPYIENNIESNYDWNIKCNFLINGLLKTGSKRCIVYLKNCNECDIFINIIKNNNLNIYCEKIDTNVNVKERTKILQDFQSNLNYDLYMIASVRILDESIDIPKCDSEFITYVGDKNSDIRTVQRLQRGGRLDDENPLKKNNLFIWTEDWSKAIDALVLIKDTDIEFHKKIKIINYKNIVINHDHDYNKSKIEEKTNEFRKYLEIKCLSLSENWLNKFSLLEEYVTIHNTIPPKNIIYKNINIGNWCSTQRYYYLYGYLKDTKKIEKLESIPEWYWGEKKIKNPSWDKIYNILKDYIEKYNKLPLIQDEYCNVRIGNWCFYQRQSYKNGRLTDIEKIKKLEDLDKWWWTDNKINTIITWNTSYNILLNYIEKYNKLPAISDKYDNYNIGEWCHEQKRKYKMNNIKDIKKINALESIKGWNWEYDQWMEYFNTLNDFVKKYNKLPVMNEEYNGIKIGNWCLKQRWYYKNDYKNDESRNKKLETIPGWIWIK